MAMTGYKMPEWAVQQIVRETGLVEDVCKHGVGHPNVEWLDQHDSEGKRTLGIHGCDGCCVSKEKWERLKGEMR